MELAVQRWGLPAAPTGFDSEIVVTIATICVRWRHTPTVDVALLDIFPFALEGGVFLSRSGHRLSDKHGIHLLTERYHHHGVKGVCRGENVVEPTSRAAMEKLIAPIGGNMTGSVDSNSHSRTT